MLYVSSNHRAPAVSFGEAVRNGLAPDGGLYLPVEMPHLPAEVMQPDSNRSLADTAFTLARLFVGHEIAAPELEAICHDAFSFPVPVVQVGGAVHAIELFHGPTFAFKDLGARFLARVMAHLLRRNDQRLTILVATSGDTGSAVAHGFAGMEGIDVVSLYPSGRVSRLQEQQLTTVCGNVTAVEVAGTFDDCQTMVKAALADAEIQALRPLSSANSINIARLLPQVFYYVDAWHHLAAGPGRPRLICVPSGNLGNLTGALIARLMGLPLDQIIAGTNANDLLPRYLATGRYDPQPVVRTPANAMDVGSPSNFNRIHYLLGGSHRRISEMLRAYAVTSEEILSTINRVHQEHGYLLDPHTAVGFAAIEQFADENQEEQAPTLLAATAHPGKFAEAIRAATGAEVEIPAGLAAAMARKKRSIAISNSFNDLRELLLDSLITGTE
jgi:threonine synthase